MAVGRDGHGDILKDQSAQAPPQSMTNEANYYSVLQSAFEKTEPDSFEARGAIYDRLWQIIIDQLHTNPETSDEEIAAERAAFLRAVQRMEFGSGPPPPEENIRQVGREAAPVERNAAPAYRDLEPFEREPAPIYRDAEPVERVATPIRRARPAKPRRRIFWRIAAAMVTACVVLLVAGMAYALIVIRSDSTVAARWIDQSAPDSLQAQMVRAVLSIQNFIERRSVAAPPAAAQRAVLYEESADTATGTTFSGRAVWRHHPKTAGPLAESLSIDVEIPQKHLFLELSMRRAPEGGVISHFVEFRFVGPNRAPSDAVDDVLGILMKTDELSRGIDLTGRVAKVRPGIFLMGLSGADGDLGRNLKLLRERGWLDIPIVFRGGTRSILAIEKGATGENALNGALATWGHG
jgi:hypothetical protein